MRKTSITQNALKTGSSFYQKTFADKCKQAETQQSEWNQQMLRIFGNTLQEGALKEITEKNTVSDSIGEINIANSDS